MKTFLNILVLAGLALCPAWSADFFPLETGNRWTYRETRTGQAFTVRVGTSVMTNDRVYYSLQGYADSTRLVRMNEQNQLVALDGDTGAEAAVTSFAPAESWWEAPFRQCAQQGQTQAKRGTHDGPAGAIREVLELRYRTFTCADAGVQGEQYAENIGMVRRVTNSFAGPRTFDLVNARVGKLTIDAGANGSFSAFAEQGAQGLSITWRLETSGDPVRLVFASGQEYDVVLRDALGRAVWQWSADQVFAQAFHERTVSGEWSATVTAPVSGLMAGSYTAQAWLTTSGSPAAFAATAPVTIR